MNALRHGVKIVRANLSDDIQAKTNSIAEQTGALVIPYDDTPALDLRNAIDPAWVLIGPTVSILALSI